MLEIISYEWERNWVAQLVMVLDEDGCIVYMKILESYRMGSKIPGLQNPFLDI